MGNTIGFQRVCSYCKKVMQEGPADNITHGICKPCSTKMIWMETDVTKKELTEYVSSMEGSHD